MKITNQKSNPFSLAEVKAYLRVTHEEEDDVIARLMDAALDYYETVTGVYLRETTFSMRFTESPVELVTRPWSSQVTAKDDDGADITTTLNDAPGEVKVVTWDSVEKGALSLVWKVGYSSRGDIPARMAQAFRALVADVYVNRQMEQTAALNRAWLNQSIFLGDSRIAV